MEILQTKIKLTTDSGGWKISNIEAISAFANMKNLERQGKRGKPAQVTLILPDDWVEEMVLHAVGSREADHNFLLMKIPREDKKPATKKKTKAAKRK